MGIHEEVQKIWKYLIDNCEFLTRMISAIKIRNGMDRTSLCNHILYSAGSTTSSAKVGANTIIEIFKASGIVTEEDGKISAINISSVQDEREKENSNLEKEGVEQASKSVACITKNVMGSQSVVNININIDARVDELDKLSEKLQLLLKTIAE